MFPFFFSSLCVSFGLLVKLITPYRVSHLSPSGKVAKLIAKNRFFPTFLSFDKETAFINRRFISVLLENKKESVSLEEENKDIGYLLIKSFRVENLLILLFCRFLSGKFIFRGLSDTCEMKFTKFKTQRDQPLYSRMGFKAS